MHKINGLRLGLWLTALAFVLVAAATMLDLPLFYENCATGPLSSMFPNMAAKDGVFSNPDADSLELKMLHEPIKLAPRTDYTVSFLVRGVQAKIPAMLIVDFVGAGYDFDAQQFQVKLEPGTRDRMITEVINSGQAVPATAELRLFFSSAASIAISQVSIIGERQKLRRACQWILAACLLLLLGLGTAEYRRQRQAAGNPNPMTGEQKIYLAAIMVFLAMIMAPKVQKEFRLFQYQPLNENRRKLEPPAGNMLTTLYTKGIEYSKEYERYYNDHYGFRDFFIQLKNQLDFDLFRRSDEVVIGKAGYMEYKNVIAVEEIRGERLTQQNWESICSHLSQFQKALQQKGITLVLMPVQMKFSIYPEYYPRGQVTRPPKTAFDRLMEYLQAHPEFNTIDARKTLLAAKEKYPVFYKTDFHWNDLGAFAVAKQTVDAIGGLSGQAVRWEHPLEYAEKPNFDGGLNRSLAVLYPPLETRLELKPTWKKHGEFLPPIPPLDIHYKANPQAAPRLLPKTLVIGDSFTHYYLENNGFYEYFSEAYMLHSRNLHDLPKYLPAGVKYVVYQFIEVQIGNSFWNPEWWPDFSQEKQSAAARPPH